MTAVTTLISVSAVLTSAVTLWQDMMHYDTVQHREKHAHMESLQTQRGTNSTHYSSGLLSWHGNYSCMQMIILARSSMYYLEGCTASILSKAATQSVFPTLH